MTRWSIDPDGVNSVLTNVDLAATELSAALDNVSTSFDELERGVGASALLDIPGAVLALIESEKARLTSIGNRIAAGSLGASTATVGYLQGDEEMAVNAQAEAGRAASSGDLSFFDAGVL